MSPVTEEWPEKYGKRLIGRTDMEDAFKRSDNLTHEEARMAIAENLRSTHTVDVRVRGVTEQVLAVDNRVAGVDDKLANVDDRVASVSEKVTEVIHGVCKSSSIQLRESIHKWFSPPDPSTNHNIACDTHHKKTATWFFKGNIYREWKSKGSLLWIHGKRAPCPNFPSDFLR